MPDDLGAIGELGGAAAIELVATTLARRGTPADKCRNCSTPIIGPYCAACGQELDTHRETIWNLLHDLVSDIVSFDSRILRTVIALLIKPGELPLAFREGRTRRYMPAVRLYLFVSLLFFLTLSVTGIALVQVELREVPNAYTVKTLPNGDIAVSGKGDSNKVIPADVARNAKDGALSPGAHSGMTTDMHFFRRIGRFHQTISASGWARIQRMKTSILKAVGNDPHSWMARNALATVEKLARDPSALNGPMTTWIPRVLFLLLPIYALILALFYIRQHKQFYFVDHLIFSLSIHTFMFALLIIAVGAAQIFSGGIVALLVLLGMSVYIFISLKRFYRQGWIMTTLKFCMISFIYTVAFLMPAMMLVLFAGLIEG
ncbi:MAG TPA: DUF3667 domain-containing protein [Rhizomicrobium sp.]|jgi:hypothetical protein